MKAFNNISEIDPEKFKITTCSIGGDICYLINPKHAFRDWAENELVFRSSIWNEQGEPVSLGFPKFWNLGERPEVFPFDPDKPWTAVEKIDGSCLIVSMYKGELIVRTRGTYNAREQMPNGHELDRFLELPFVKYFASARLGDHPFTSASYIFEWTSPTNRIVLDYGNEPHFKLIGIINHNNYSLDRQSLVDSIARLWKLERPKTYKFEKFTDLLNNVKLFDDKEGVCVYYDNEQHIVKVKSLWYLKLHAFKSNCTFGKILDLVEEQNYPTEEEFNNWVLTEFDYETLTFFQWNITQVYKAISIADWEIRRVEVYVKMKEMLSQKEFAETLMHDETGTDHTIKSLAFAIRGTKSTKKLKRKLIENILERFTPETKPVITEDEEQ